MVVIRIKNDGNNQFPEKISSENIKVLSDLKLCKILENDYDEKIEKKIEFVTSDNTNNINNIYGIYNIIKNEHNFFEHNRWNKSGYSIDTSQHRNDGNSNKQESVSNPTYDTQSNTGRIARYNSKYNSGDNPGYNLPESSNDDRSENTNTYGSYSKAGHKYCDRNTNPRNTNPGEHFTRSEQRNDTTGESYRKSYRRTKYS